MAIHHTTPSSPNGPLAGPIMSATATASSSFKSPSHSHSHSRSSRPSTTPRGPPNAVSVGQSMPPLLSSPKTRSPQPVKDAKSPSYFGFVVGGDDSIPPDSNPGAHARQNWTFPGTAIQSSVPTPRHVPLEANPEFEAFRRQSEQRHRFNLSNSVTGLSRPSQIRTQSANIPLTRPTAEAPISPGAKNNHHHNSKRNNYDHHDDRPSVERSITSSDGERRLDNHSFFDIPRQQSPGPINSRHSVADHQHARLSLPTSELHAPTFNKLRQPKRSDTAPLSGESGTPTMASPTQIADLLKSDDEDVLVLDLRVYQLYATSRILGALNLCMPTTLLKRPSITVQRLADTFTSDGDRATFERWRACQYIVVYDSTTSQPKEAVTPFNVLKKFISEGFTGVGLVVKGGFVAFSRAAPELIDKGPVTSGKGSSTGPSPLSAPGPDAIPVAGGCSMPATRSVANPFFGNIRQNMDLVDGVGQMPIKKPANMSERMAKSLPTWLRAASTENDEGKLVSSKFLSIEQSEQKRMQEALTANVSYGTSNSGKPTQIQVAGIEKGSKNRYNNIFPYDHSRVRIQDVPSGSCDYINASHVKAEYSYRHYIATQAPIPATFNDFWRMVWEQDVRVIVVLTAEAEGGQIKSHVYWDAGEYGPFKLKQLSERQVTLDSNRFDNKRTTGGAARRPSLGQRRSTTANVPGDIKAAADNVHPDASTVTVRHFTLAHSSYPFQPIREITQLQYSQWPDFGAPASPTALVGLVDLVNKCVQRSARPTGVVEHEEAVSERQRPIMVHCSAGCGRTGTFCTIDSVIDMLKRQRLQRAEAEQGGMDLDTKDDWIRRDNIDLVAKTVDDFRRQRLSMVQNLRQFVLCYESVLQWFAAQEADDEDQNQNQSGKDGTRRSYG